MSEFPLDWHQVRVGDLLTEHSDRSTSNNQYEVLSVTKDGIFSQREYFKKQIASEDNTGYKVVKRGDVVFSAMNLWMGSIDLVRQYESGIVSPAYITLRPRTDLIDTEFLSCFLRGETMRKKYVQHSQQGASIVRRNLNKHDLLDDEIAIPPLPEQRKIAEILSGIDKAIRIKVAKQEKHKRATDLVLGNLLNKKGALEVPLSEFATLERGRFSHRPRNDPAYYGGSIPFIQTGDIPKSGIGIAEHKQTLNENGLRVSRIFPKGTLVITIAATIGEVGILQYPACFPDSLVGIIAKEDRCNPIYLLFALRNLKDKLLQMAPQSAQSNLNLEILAKLMVPLPPLSYQDMIARIFSCETKRYLAETMSLAKLQDLKAALTSDLLSGRKRVSV